MRLGQTRASEVEQAVSIADGSSDQGPRFVHGPQWIEALDPVPAAVEVVSSGLPIVAVGGMMRSGSSWLYNAVRLVLEHAGVRLYGFRLVDWDPSDLAGADVLVVKTHREFPALAASAWRSFTSHRDLRDVATSLIDLLRSEGWLVSGEDMLSIVDWSVVNHALWCDHGALDLQYERVAASPEEAVGAVARHLDISLEGSDIARVVRDLEKLPLSSDPGAVHPVTRLAWRHRFGGQPGRYQQDLSPYLRDKIEDRHRDWLSGRGYEVASAASETVEVAWSTLADLHAALDAGARQARGLQEICDERQAVIDDLVRVCEERLVLIERLSRSSRQPA